MNYIAAAEVLAGQHYAFIGQKHVLQRPMSQGLQTVLQVDKLIWQQS